MEMKALGEALIVVKRLRAEMGGCWWLCVEAERGGGRLQRNGNAIMAINSECNGAEERQRDYRVERGRERTVEWLGTPQAEGSQSSRVQTDSSFVWVF